MIAGIGTDLVEISRLEAVIERQGERFVQRILTDEEQVFVYVDIFEGAMGEGGFQLFFSLEAGNFVEEIITSYQEIKAPKTAELIASIEGADRGYYTGIAGIFDQFRCAPTREKKWRLVEIKRAIDFAHHFACAFCFSAHHNAVRAFEVRDGRTLAQKFRI